MSDDAPKYEFPNRPVIPTVRSGGYRSSSPFTKEDIIGFVLGGIVGIGVFVVMVKVFG